MLKVANLTEREKITAHIEKNEIVRAKEFRQLGISGTAIAKAVQDGLITQHCRGLYLSENCIPEMHFEYAETAKKFPNYPICLDSALFFYGVTVLIPHRIWIAIPASGWKPKESEPLMETIRFREPYFSEDRASFRINGVDVLVYSLEKTLADSFRNPKLVRRPVAIEALRTALEEKKTTSFDIRKAAKEYGAYKVMLPYLEALTTYA